ncbi:23722_t:CDS:1, partial [Racocetra persica]
FDEIYQHETSEQFKSSNAKFKSEESSISIFINNFIRLLVACDFCKKYHCIYSKTILNKIEIQAITQHLENIIYSCGFPIVSDDHFLANTLHIQLNLICNSPIEYNYYSCRLKDIDLYYWCGVEDELLKILSDIPDNWKTIYPLCESCYNEEKTWKT